MLNERHVRVLQMKKDGKTFKEIGLELGVSANRASQIFNSAEGTERRGKQSEKWTYGLGKKTANALISAGYVDKDSVIEGLSSGKFGIHPQTGKGNIPGIGYKGIAEISQWAGVNSPYELALRAAIVLIESQGYKVCKA